MDEQDIKQDEVVVEMAFDYAGKRDHWASDPSDHTARIEAFEKEMEIRRSSTSRSRWRSSRPRNTSAKRTRRRSARKKKKGGGGGEGGETGGGDDEGGEDEEEDEEEGDANDADTDDEEGNDLDKEDEADAVLTQKMNANRNGGAKMSVRNLRIQEDLKVPPQPRCQLGVLRPEDAIDARGAAARGGDAGQGHRLRAVQ